MSDRKLEAMLQVASTLTEDDLDCLRGIAGVATVELTEEASEAAAPAAPDVADAMCPDDETEVDEVPSPAPNQLRAAQGLSARGPDTGEPVGGRVRTPTHARVKGRHCLPGQAA